jgi:hypothetical protein
MKRMREEVRMMQTFICEVGGEECIFYGGSKERVIFICKNGISLKEWDVFGMGIAPIRK